MSQVLISQRAKIGIILGLALLGIALWKWDQKSPFPALTSKEASTPTTPSAFNSEQPGTETAVPTLKAPLPSTDQNWQNCVQDPSHITDLAGLLKDSLPEDILSQADTTIQNIHVLTPQGDELRLHERINDISGKQELVLFAVDEQGYPLPQKFPAEIQTVSNEEKRNWFLRQGSISLSEKIHDLNTSQVQARWKERNQKISQIEIFLPDRSISCGDSLESCRCRH